MEDDVVSSNLTKEDENLPRSCGYFKLLMVEELALERKLEKLHIGKCSVIGRLFQNSEGDFELESLRLPHLPKEFVQPEGTFSIRLLDFDLFKSSPPLKSGRYCEASGIVVLLRKNPEKIPANNLITTYELHLKLRQLDTLEAKTQYLEEIQATHIVALKLHFTREVDRACDLVERNLALRKFIREYQ